MAYADNTSQPPTEAIARLLSWYQEMGAVGALEHTPIDWRGRTDAPGAGFAWPQETPSEPRPNRAVIANGAPTAPMPAPGPPLARQPTAAEANQVRTFDGKPLAGRLAGRPSDQNQGHPSARQPVIAPANVQRAPSPGPSRAASLGLDRIASLDELAVALDAFDGCGLKATAKNLVLYRGAKKARVMIIGEAPGREEDIAGKPFVGAAGQLLDLMLAAIGLTEADVHIANVVYWRPPGNRNPTPIEAAACAPFLDRQIWLVAPDLLYVLGGVAAKHMFDTDDGITRIRGRWRPLERGGRTMRAMPSLHPAYLLRTPAAKRQAWRDLLALRAAIDGKD